MIEETRAITQTLQGVVSVRVSADHACGYFYTRKPTRNSRSNDNTPLLIGGSGTKQYLICLCQSISLLRELSLTSDRSAVVFFFFFSVCDIAPPPRRVFARPPL